MPRPTRAATRTTCATCGNVHVKCSGHRKTNKGPCGMNPADGAEVCRMHGGGAPQVKAAAARRVHDEKVKRALATYGIPVDDGDPEELLLEEVRRTAGHVLWVGSKIAELDEEALIWGQKQATHQEGTTVEGYVNVDTTVDAAGLHAWLDVYMKERAHLVKACKTAIDAGIKQRMVEAAELAGERHGEYLQALLGPLNLRPDQLSLVVASAPQHLHLLKGIA
jgi:hypothetical protein